MSSLLLTPISLAYFAPTDHCFTGGPPGRGGPGGLDPTNPQIARLIRGNVYSMLRLAQINQCVCLFQLNLSHWALVAFLQALTSSTFLPVFFSYIF